MIIKDLKEQHDTQDEQRLVAKGSHLVIHQEISQDGLCLSKFTLVPSKHLSFRLRIMTFLPNDRSSFHQG